MMMGWENEEFGPTKLFRTRVRQLGEFDVLSRSTSPFHFVMLCNVLYMRINVYGVQQDSSGTSSSGKCVLKSRDYSFNNLED
jgi:hypothetical protein